MADAVKKREKVPADLEPVTPAKPPPEDVKFKIGDKEYPIPKLTYGEYKKLAKIVDEFQSKDMSEITEVEAFEATREFYYRLLKPHYPELKKSDFDNMPLYQLGTEFYVKVKIALMRVPLGS